MTDTHTYCLVGAMWRPLLTEQAGRLLSLGTRCHVVDRYLSAAVLGRYLIATEDHNFDTAAKPSTLKGKRHFHDVVFVMKVCGVVHCNHYKLKNHNMNMYHHQDLRSHFIAAVKLFCIVSHFILRAKQLGVWLGEYGGSCLLRCFAVLSGINIVKEILTFFTAVSTTNADERGGEGELIQITRSRRSRRGPKTRL